MTLKTDHKWHDFLHFFELTPKEKAELDWVENETAPVLKYRGNVYALDEFERVSPHEGLKGWNGKHCDTAFSAVVIALSDDGERYKIGYVYG